jgi:heme exporter protein B
MSEPSLRLLAKSQIQRDFRLYWQRRGSLLQTLLFAVMVISLFPFAIGSDPSKLSALAPGILWVVFLLASLLNLEELFRSDVDDGSLEQILLSESPLEWLLFVRFCVYWCVSGLPLLLVSPLLAQMLFFPNDYLHVLVISLLIGSLLLSFIGAVMAALTAGIRRSGILITLLSLPLFMPVLIFGAGSVSAATQGLDWIGPLLMLAAALVLVLVLAPIAAAAALKISLS